MTLAAIVAGDEQADFEVSRQTLADLLSKDLPSRYAGRDLADSELRVAIGLSA